MADMLLNQAKGLIDWTTDDLRLLLVKTTGSSNPDHDNLTAFLADTGGECDFTNYARNAAPGISRTVNDTLDRGEIDITDWVIANAGGATNNTIAGVLVYKHVDGTNGNDIPVQFSDLNLPTNGGQVTIDFATPYLTIT